MNNFGVYSAQIAGTPTQVQTTNFTLQVTDGVGDTAQQAFTLTINPPQPLVITSGSCCPDGTVGTAYHTNFFASGGVQPYTWSISSGQIPPGLRLAASPPAGLSGTPTTRGTFTFTVTVTDSKGTRTSEPGSITVSWSVSYPTILARYLQSLSQRWEGCRPGVAFMLCDNIAA